MITVAATALTVNVAGPANPTPPLGWEGVDTSFDDLQAGARCPVAALQVAQWVQERMLQSRAKVVVFPETIVPRWTAATELFWQQTLAAAETSGKTVLIGAGLPMPDTDRYENAVIILGRGTREAVLQRIPVPVGMWRPFGKAGVPLHLTGAGVVWIARRRAAILICYEQLLTWPILVSAGKPCDVIVGLANDHWVADSPVPLVREAAMISWARLFALPLICASNR
jgi:apolipoprotein N-acyltransferase